MESKLGNFDGVEILRKKRTLDLKSIYGPEGVEGVNESSKVRKRVKREEYDNVGGEGRKRKKMGSKKNVAVNSMENYGRKIEKSLDEVYCDGINLVPGNMGEMQLGLSQKSGNGLTKESDGISLGLEDNVARIPKRKHDSVWDKRVEHDKSQKVAGGKLDTDSCRVPNQVSGLANDICTVVENKTVLDIEEESLKVTLKEKLEHHKENNTSGSKKANLVYKAKLDVMKFVGDGSDPTLKSKQKERRRKRKTEVCPSSETRKERSSSVAEPIDNSAGLLEDEEENLEQNAARMLSSRFNPGLIGVSGDRNDSSNDVNVDQSTRAGFITLGQSAMAESDSALDDTGIVLRPRKEHKAKSFFRKRRHFYEVMYEDLDPLWVLKKRIKIFWALDKSWYVGLVKDYDPKKKQHRVKYEDREEEWIDLRGEKFKLLLFPSEIPCKADKTRSTVRDFHSERKRDVVDSIKSSGLGNFKDSEPIISWLSRTNRKVKPISSGHIKKPKPRLKSQMAIQVGFEDVGCPFKDFNNPSAEATFPVYPRVSPGVRGIARDEAVSSRIINFPAVYYRRRVRSRGMFHNSEDKYMFGFASERVAYFDRLIENSLRWGEIDAFLGKHDNETPLCIAHINKLLIPLDITHISYFNMDISLQGFPVMEGLPVVYNCWLLHSFFLLQYGAVTCLWPKVQLEILVVDNNAGFKLFLFENYLFQSIAIIFRILSIFGHYPDWGKYTDLQRPVTSVRFRFSSPFDPKKQILYSFFCFSQLSDRDWSYLDFELKRHCLFVKQLDPHECTYDNIDTLLSELNHMSSIVPSKKRASVECEWKCNEHSLFGLSSSIILDQHLERLIGPRVMCISSAASDSFPSSEWTETSERCIVNCYSEPCNGSSEIDSPNRMTAFGDPKVSIHGGTRKKMVKNSVNVCNDVNRKKMLKEHSKINCSTGSYLVAPSNFPSRNVVQTNDRLRHQLDVNQSGSKLLSLKTPVLQGKSNSRRQSHVNGLAANISLSVHVNKNGDGKAHFIDLAGQLKHGVISRANPTAPRSIGRRNKNTSPSFGHFSRAWHDRKTEFDRNGFKSGTKKPWPQASYSLSDVDTNCISNQRNSQLKENSHKKMKKPQEKTVDSPRSPRKDLDSLSCAGNILIILEDRGYRECEAQVFLQPADHNEWILSVKVAGIPKYSYKANQLLQSGATNRSTHAMMWKGGKNWTFEFPDRSQWVLFKEMHSECYNRNLRAASLKIIPIPGVRLVDDFDDNFLEAAPFSFHPNYYLQSKTDVEMALNSSRVLYDMDSEDEQWLSENQGSSEDNGSEGLPLFEEFFEKMMDMFEKTSHVRKHDQFTHQEIEELFTGIGPTNVIMKIHDYWSQKRRRTGMPLLRQLQPPLWERYQKQLQEWELGMGRSKYPLLNDGNKPPLHEKPPMYAFCLKPRGLEVPSSRGSHQRSHKKYHGPGYSSAAMGDHDGYDAYGRRYNRFIYVDEKFTSPWNYDSEFSPRLFSLRDESMAYCSMDGGFDIYHQPRPYRIKSKKIGSPIVPVQPQSMTSCNPQATPINIEPLQSKTRHPDWPYLKTYLQPQTHLRFPTDRLDGPELEEFKLGDASGAAQHALIMAKLKRQQAERLHYLADLAMHKAMVALMIAKAMKESQSQSS